MKRLVGPLALSLSLALAACSEQQPSEPVTEIEPDAPPEFGAPPEQPTEDQLALLDADDCRTVAAAYLDAVARRDFGFAEEFWDDPVVDAARLEALFTGYERPMVEIAEVMEEGAAGTLYCTVTGTLADAGDPARSLIEGEIVLTRVNDVPGATAEQLRWRVVSSTYIEPLQRAGRGEPA